MGSPKRSGIKPFLGLVVAILAVQMAAAQDSATTDDVQPDVVILVKGMACENCAYSMEKQLGKLESVSEVDVRLDEQKVFVTLAADATVDEAALRKAVLDAGFETVGLSFRSNRPEAKEGPDPIPDGS